MGDRCHDFQMMSVTVNEVNVTKDIDWSSADNRRLQDEDITRLSSLGRVNTTQSPSRIQDPGVVTVNDTQIRNEQLRPLHTN